MPYLKMLMRLRKKSKTDKMSYKFKYTTRYEINITINKTKILKGIIISIFF